MIFGQDRDELRRMYADAWHKHRDGRVMSQLELQIATVIGEHPEFVDAIEHDVGTDFAPEGGRTNPFLHMGLHLGIREQVATDRPQGINAIFHRLTGRIGDAHKAEHRMIDCLAEVLWEAQRQNQPPDEARYLARLRDL